MGDGLSVYVINVDNLYFTNQFCKVVLGPIQNSKNIQSIIYFLGF